MSAGNFEVGQSLEPLIKPEISESQLADYAKVSEDHNPIHLDAEFAKGAGFPSVIAHGMISMAFLGDYLRVHFPENRYQLQKLKCRFRKVTFPGDRITCSGKVRRQDGDVLIVGLEARNQNGDLTTDAEARVSPLS